MQLSAYNTSSGQSPRLWSQPCYTGHRTSVAKQPHPRYTHSYLARFRWSLHQDLPTSTSQNSSNAKENIPGSRLDLPWPWELCHGVSDSPPGPGSDVRYLTRLKIATFSQVKRDKPGLLLLRSRQETSEGWLKNREQMHFPMPVEPWWRHFAGSRELHMLFVNVVPSLKINLPVPVLNILDILSNNLFISELVSSSKFTIAMTFQLKQIQKILPLLIPLK